MLEYVGTLLTIDHFKDGSSQCFSFISHIYLKRLVSLVYRLLRKDFPVDTGRKLNVHKMFRRHPPSAAPKYTLSGFTDVATVHLKIMS